MAIQKMATQKQIDANRRNSQKSTGPVTPAGKSASAMNALKTGIHAQTLVLPTENPADLEALTAEYYRHHHPHTPEARCLVDELIACEWSLRRLRAAETQLWDFAFQDVFKPNQDLPLGQVCAQRPKPFGQLQWRIDSTRRAFHRALQALQQLEDVHAVPPTEVRTPSVTRSPAITSVEIGSVLKTLPAGRLEPKKGPRRRANPNPTPLDPPVPVPIGVRDPQILGIMELTSD
jgi:hypothetical protein